jgi:hypothetical protein
MEAVAAEAVPRIHEFSQQNLSNLCWAFGKLAHFNAKLMAAIAERAVVLIKVLYIGSMLGCQPADVYSRLCRHSHRSNWQCCLHLIRD